MKWPLKRKEVEMEIKKPLPPKVSKSQLIKEYEQEIEEDDNINEDLDGGIK